VMSTSNQRLGRTGGLSAIVAFCAALAVVYACGSSPPDNGFGPVTGAGSSGGSSGGSSAHPGTGSSGGTSSGGGNGTGGGPFVIPDASSPKTNAGDATTPVALVPAMGVATASDCTGCTFPPPNAPACATAPAIKIVYPNDTVVVPPNLNVISVHWTPFGPPFTNFEVDFSQSSQTPATDWRIITSCMAQTTDMQTTPPTPSGGCELVVDPASWSKIVGANRGLNSPISITVRGTTDGMCASTSSNTIHMSIAEEDLTGTYYYWKSTITAGQGVGGFIWAKAFGDLANPEVNVTPNPKPLNSTCNGCHSLSRDGSRMVVYSDDNDSDDEYNDVAGSELDMTPLPAGVAVEFAGGITQGGGGGGGQPPGFTTINPQATTYVTSNGSACTTVAGAGGGRGGQGCGGGYATAVPTNGWSVWNAATGAFVNGVAISPTGTRPTMPDWSIDGTTIVYVQPQGEFTTWKQDDAHVYGGSLYTVPYAGNGTFGTPQAILTSAGENNYYPSFSPDQPMSFIIFNRVASMGAAATCTGGFCPDDSFSNPAARLWLMQAPSAANPTPMPVDLQKANGAIDPWSNSYPRWAPFVQNYHGNKILWFTFSSTRDYGLRVLNHKTGMVQCYPADAAETPGGAHKSTFATACQVPQLWMAPIMFAGGQAVTADPSGVAFWVPYQDITSHNHTAQWTQQAPQPPACTCGMLNGACGPANGGCPCCSGQSLVCTATGTCIQVPN